MLLAFRADPTRFHPRNRSQSEKTPFVNSSPMYSLYHSLLAQHPRQLMPVPYAGSTLAQLHRYFEDVVVENNLGAMEVESLPTSTKRPARDNAPIKELDKSGQSLD